MLTDALAILAQVLFFFNFIFAFIIVFFEKRNPAGSWAWLFVVLFVPYIGFLIYLLLGFDSRKYATFAKKYSDDETISEEILTKNLVGLKYLKDQLEAENINDYFRNPNISMFNDLAYMNFKSGRAAMTENNEVDLYSDGNAKFAQLFKDISKAKKFIHMQYYIFRSDSLGKQILSMLTQKASEGVEVRLFIDGMGSLMHQTTYQPLLDAGGLVAVFMPPHFIRLNFRNHRKICVVDGDIGYIGGLNVGDEYIGKKTGFSPWRDTHIRIRGDAAKELQLRFFADWNYVSKNKLQATDFYFPVLENKAGAAIQIVSSGPDTKWHSVYNGYSKMISDAKTSIYIETPYFAPDDNIFESLRIAALSGIDVRIIIPANPDHPFVYWASLSYLGELLKAGVKCYKYKTGFIHSKLVVIDSNASSTGTANMDLRSFRLNFEINAFIFDSKIAKDFEKEFLNDLQCCEEITTRLYESRSGIQKIKEAVSRLLSPLL